MEETLAGLPLVGSERPKPTNVCMAKTFTNGSGPKAGSSVGQVALPLIET